MNKLRPAPPRCFSHYVVGIAILLLTSVVSSVAQVTITGQVIDASTGGPVPGATVRLQSSGQAVATDSLGRFILSVSSVAEDTLVVTHVRYRRERTPLVTLGDAARAELTIELTPALVPVGSFTVLPTRAADKQFSLPQSVSVTTRDEFPERNPATTADLLRDESGILVQKTTHAHGSPIIRGLLGKYVLLLYDGIRLNQPTFRFGANQYLNTVDFESLGSIEVVRGPSSVLFGSDAIGGVVNLVPADPADECGRDAIAYRGTVKYTGADHGGSSHLGLSGAKDPLAVSYEMTYKEIGNLHAGGSVGAQEPTGWREADHSARIGYRLADKRHLRASFLSVRQNEVPRYDKYVSGDFQQYIYDPQDRYLGVLTYEDTRSGWLIDGAKISLAYQNELEGHRLQRAGSSAITYTRDEVATWGGFARLSSSFLRSHWLAYGLEYYHHRVLSGSRREEGSLTEAQRPSFPDDSRYWELGFYVQDEWSHGDRLVLTGGMRYSLIGVDSPLEYPFDHYKETFSDLTGSLAASYLVTPAANLVGRWSRGFRAPSLNDAVVLKYSSSGVDAPSPGLNPEHCNNFEIGLKVAGRRFSGSAFVFCNQLYALIVRAPGTYAGLAFYDENGNGLQDEGEFDIYQKFNTDRARIYGFEVESAMAVGNGVDARVSLAWTFGENLTAHEPLTRIPPLLGAVSVVRSLGLPLRLGGYLRFAGPQRRLSSGDKEDTRIDPEGTPGWVTVGLFARLALSSFTVNFGLENLFDQAYKVHGSGIYSAGRSINLAVTYAGS